MTDYADWVGKTAYDKNGTKLGTIEDLFMDDDADKPEWATIKSGLFGMKRHLVPMILGRIKDGEIRFNATEDHIKDAPGIDDENELSADDDDRLRRHYADLLRDYDRDDRDAHHEPRHDELDDDRRSVRHDDAPLERAAHHGEDRPERRRDEVSHAEASARDEVSRAHDDGKPAQPRLRRYTVTEQVQVTVPVQREVVQVEDDRPEQPRR